MFSQEYFVQPGSNEFDFALVMRLAIKEAKQQISQHVDYEIDRFCKEVTAICKKEGVFDGKPLC